jgi:nucleoside-diphosphate-sugar epimerase
MRVLVTGHDGYLGSVLVTRLRAAGHTVVGLDTGLYADCLLGPAPEPVEALRVDLRDVTAEHCAGFDAVLHLAALCNDPIGNLNPDLTYDINHRSTVRLAAAAKAAGVSRFLFSSSCSLYGKGDGQSGPRGSAGRPGPSADDRPLDESAAFAPVTPYGESKILSEQSLHELADDDFSPTYLRNATAYGYSPRLRGDIVVNDLTASALLTGEVRLMSDGMAWRPLVHADDIAAAFIALLDAPREVVHDRPYNIGQTEENYLIRDVAEIVADVLPGSKLTFAEGAGTDLRNYRVSCDRIAAEVPGFSPQWTVRKGVEQLVEAYQRHGLTHDDMYGERYQRIKRIRALQGAGRLDADLRWTA